MLISSLGALLLEDLNLLLLLLLSSLAGSGLDSVFFLSTLKWVQLEQLHKVHITYVGVVRARFLNSSRSFNKAGSILRCW